MADEMETGFKVAATGITLMSHFGHVDEGDQAQLGNIGPVLTGQGHGFSD